MTTTRSRMKQRTDTTAVWNARNPILADGEYGIEVRETGPRRVKLGDGATPWVSLLYFGEPQDTGFYDLRSYYQNPANGYTGPIPPERFLLVRRVGERTTLAVNTSPPSGVPPVTDLTPYAGTFPLPAALAAGGFEGAYSGDLFNSSRTGVVGKIVIAGIYMNISGTLTGSPSGHVTYYGNQAIPTPMPGTSVPGR